MTHLTLVFWQLCLLSPSHPVFLCGDWGKFALAMTHTACMTWWQAAFPGNWPKLALSESLSPIKPPWSSKSDLQFPLLLSSCPFHAKVSTPPILYRTVFNRSPRSQSMPRPSLIKAKITTTRSILVMAPDEFCTNLGVATKMPQKYLNTPCPKLGFHRGQHINSFTTKALLTAIRSWTLHREWWQFIFCFFL